MLYCTFSNSIFSIERYKMGLSAIEKNKFGCGSWGVDTSHKSNQKQDRTFNCFFCCFCVCVNSNSTK